MKGSAPVHYSIIPIQPEAHLFEVTCYVDKPDLLAQTFYLPAWVPGSYMIREFAKNVVQVFGVCKGKPVSIDKVDKHTWVVTNCSGPLTLRYLVYAWDLSVRAAYLDTTRGFFNGSSVLLCVSGFERGRCSLDILAPKGKQYSGWKVATTMPRSGAKQYSFGRYQAQDYEELIDHPVEIGCFSQTTFKARGVTHDIVIAGRHDADMMRLQKDLKTLCEQHIHLFREKPPMKHYMFLVAAVGQGYAGLEHRSSTALLCSRNDLPNATHTDVDENYQTFLGLCSHEYFHLWNVKRIKPQAFIPYDLTRECYTRSLWAFEGITSYYDDLALVRAGLIAPERYLELLAKTITIVLRGSGRTKQSVSESSFDAWIKYYRQDENSPNAIVSYYAKGALVALALDLLIRTRTKEKLSLDDVMLALWQNYGKTGIGLAEQEIEKVAQDVSGVDLSDFFDHAVRGTSDLPLRELLEVVGIRMEMRVAESVGDKGGKPAAKKHTYLLRRPHFGAVIGGSGVEAKLKQVLDGGAAQLAGLSAGDVVVAIDGIRVTRASFEPMLNRHVPGESVEMYVFRRDELMTFRVKLLPPPVDTCFLRMDDKPSKSALRLRNEWLRIVNI